jgi:GAF domain-containing protein
MAKGPQSELARAFAELSAVLSADEDVHAVLERLVQLAPATVASCAYASFSLLGTNGRITTPVATDPLGAELDGYQYAADEGPCVEAVRNPAPAVYSSDLATDERWPTFGPRAAGRGARSLLSHKIAADGTIGAVNLYAIGPEAFGEPDQEVASLLAMFGSVVMAFVIERTKSNQLRRALESRDVIGQAKGILMERERVTADQAFDMLRRSSQQLNRKLRDLAEEMTETGEEPPTLR